MAPQDSEIRIDLEQWDTEGTEARGRDAGVGQEKGRSGVHLPGGNFRSDNSPSVDSFLNSPVSVT